MMQTIVGEQQVRAWNDRHPVGTRVRYWPLTKARDAKETTTRSEATLLAGVAPVVRLEGVPGCVSLSHVEAVEGDQR